MAQVFLPHARLTRHPRNMRRNFPRDQVRRMALSQAERARRGLTPCVHDLVVTPGPGLKWNPKGRQALTIVAGHLRHAGNAYLGADAPLLNCVVRDYASEADLLADMTAENGVRADPGPLGWALHLRERLAGGATMRQVVRESGKSRWQVEGLLRLLALDERAQARIDAGDLPLGAIDVLAQVTDPSAQGRLADELAKRHVGLRGVKLAVAKWLEGAGRSRPAEKRAGERLAGRRAAGGPAEAQRRATGGAPPQAPRRPAVDGLLPPEAPVTAETMRAAARQTCAGCAIGQNLRIAEPAWHMAHRAAGHVCDNCSLRDLESGCNGCPLAEFMGRLVRAGAQAA